MKNSAISAYMHEHLSDCRMDDAEHISGRIVFTPDFPGFDGHFPEYPLVPGVCLIEAVRCTFEKAVRFPVTVAVIRSCRFRAQVVPDTEVVVKITLKGAVSERCQLQAELFAGETSALRVSMIVEKGE